MNRINTRKLVVLSMIVALSYALSAILNYPIFPNVPFIKYTPGDIILIIGGLILGPSAAFLTTLAEPILHGITVGQSGPIGTLMNIISTSIFILTISLVYKKFKSPKGLVFALILGTIAITLAMIPLNIIFIPLFMKVPREKIYELILPTIIPVNFIKALISSVAAFTIFKSIKKFIKEEDYE